MLDIKYIKENPEEVVARLAMKGKDAKEEIAKILELDAKRRAIIGESESLKAEQNKVTKMIPALKKEGKDTTEIFKQMGEMKAKAKELDEELKAYFIAAHNLKVSAKKISRIRGVYSNKLSKRKKKKHEIKICNYNDSLNSYANIASRIRWLLDTFASCADGAVAASKSKRAANKLRKRADEYSLKILKEKTRIEDITDGVVMPVSTYVN